MEVVDFFTLTLYNKTVYYYRKGNNKNARLE
nr:MAG TPA: hypothetical protein [Caudoviricetes sp.]